MAKFPFAFVKPFCRTCPQCCAGTMIPKRIGSKDYQECLTCCYRVRSDDIEIIGRLKTGVEVNEE